MNTNIAVAGKRDEHLQFIRKNATLYPDFRPLLFTTLLCLPLLGKMRNLVQTLVKSKELFHSIDKATGSQESEISVFSQ